MDPKKFHTWHFVEMFLLIYGFPPSLSLFPPLEMYLLKKLSFSKLFYRVSHCLNFVNCLTRVNIFLC